MKSVIFVALALVAVAVPLPVDVAVALPVDEAAQMFHFEFNQQPEGSYKYDFQTSGRINRQETVELKNPLNEDNKPDIVVVIGGSYTYPNEDGKPEVSYIADESKFHAEGQSN